jgi:hypothetical protein
MIARALSLRLDVAALSAVAIIAFIMGFTANPEPSIVSFEFAHRLEEVDALFAQWGPEGKRLARRSLYWDFPFILAYSTCLALLCWRAYHWSLQRWLPAALIVAIAALQLVAGLLDIGENLCLLQLLDGQREAWLPLAAYWLAAAKFTLVGLGILAVLAGLIAWGVNQAARS